MLGRMVERDGGRRAEGEKMKSLMRRKLTVSEQRQVSDAIDEQLAENVRRMSGDVAAAVLWALRQEYGFGKKRLCRFYAAFRPLLRELAERYEMHDGVEYVCRVKLREIGVEVDDEMMNFGYKYRRGK